MIFGPLAVIVLLQFTSDENRYIRPQEATRIALDHYDLEREPPNLELAFDEDPPASAGAEVIWTVVADETPQAPCFEVEIDAATGEVLTACGGGQ